MLKICLASWYWGPSEADDELFDDTFHNSSEMTSTIPSVISNPDAHELNTACPSSYACTKGILTPQSDMLSSPVKCLTLPSPSNLHNPEERNGPLSAFLFVDNSDKKLAARLRNVLTNRKQRRQKMSRVAELEEKLRAMESERNTWKRKAEFWRKASAENQNKSTRSC